MCSETEDHDQVLLRQTVADQEGRHILALIPLQLDDLPELLIIHDVAVAAELCSQSQDQLEQRRYSQLNSNSKRESGRPAFRASVTGTHLS